ncbi:MAG TPA: ACP S-malonyltransferase [Burkholderiales bacterium]|nr:ACP S-malonyltransferase [Burkholderiales bacterium]
MNLGFVFPGQGSQSLGMMAGFESLPAVRRTFDEAGAALAVDLWELVTSGPEEELNKTVNTQPVMLVAGVALFRAWKELGGRDPILLAGHSLGEYSALVAAGVIEFADAVPLVRFRAQAMQEAVPEGLGAIAAILGLDEEAVRSVCMEAAAAGVVEAANFNSPVQVVIAGEAAGVQRAIELAKARGAKRAVLLPMSAPSHCSLMRPAAERLRERLAHTNLRRPLLRVINNVDAATEDAPERIRDALVRQLYHPVRWVETVRTLARSGVRQVVECGPGGVLTALGKRTAPDLPIVAPKDAGELQALATNTNGGTR